VVSVLLNMDQHSKLKRNNHTHHVLDGKMPKYKLFVNVSISSFAL